MPANYDKIANYYDFLSGIVFGHSLINAQTCLLKYIRPDSDILIVGGGTGLILEEISMLYRSNLRITYLEISGKMIARAKKRNWNQNEVHFIHQAAEEFISQKQYDIILTPFLFDNFTESKIQNIFSSLDTMMVPGGNWLFADFNYDKTTGKLWQKILLKIMYSFFRLTCGIEAKALISMESTFKNSGYANIFEASHYAGFIKSIAYRKQ